MPPSSFRWSNPSVTTLEIPLLSRYVSGTSDVVARIELGRQDGWKSIGSGEGKELSVLSAFINGRVRPQGVRSVRPFYLSGMNINLFPVGGSCRDFHSYLAWLLPLPFSPYHSLFWSFALSPPFGGNMAVAKSFLRLYRAHVRGLCRMRSVRGGFGRDH